MEFNIKIQNIKNSYRIKSTILLLFFITASVFPALSFSQFYYGLGYSIEYTDNINLATDSLAQEEITDAVIVQLSYRERRSKELSATIDAQVERRNYRRHTLEDESLFSLNSDLTWSILPQRLSWNLQDIFRQERIDPQEVLSASNRQDVNTLSTGPNISIRINPLNTFNVNARYSNIYYEELDTDNNRLSAVANWSRRLAPRKTFSANIESTTVNYNDDAYIDYDQIDMFLRYSVQPARTEYLLDAGVSYIDYQKGNDVEGLLTRFTLDSSLTSSSNVRLIVNASISDAGHEPIGGTGEALASEAILGEDVGSPNVFFEKRVDLEYSRRERAISSSISLFFRDRDYKESTDVFEQSDLANHGASVTIEADLLRATRFLFEATYSKSKYDLGGREDIDKTSRVSLIRRISRKINLLLEMGLQSRVSSSYLDEYKERHGLISISYHS